jgi:hypothetical protein
MNLRAAVTKVVKASGLKPLRWAQDAGIPKSTFRDLMRDGTASGRTLAKLQAAGVTIADRSVIRSLDAA